MLLFKQIRHLQAFLLDAREKGQSIGFVPTMGALHDGHISLISRSKQDLALTVCSIFVNPTQFNSKEDFDKYPITIEKDIDLLEKNGCDVLFLPSMEEIYPPVLPMMHYELGYLETILEGAYRPGHFQGVCQVVDRLLNIVQPDKLYLGRKDYQQCMVISKLIDITGSRTEIIIAETMREPGGLAMSSRNARLSDQSRKTAQSLYKTLRYLHDHLQPGDVSKLKLEGLKQLESSGFKVDYVELANATNLDLITDWNGQTPVVALIAAYIDGVRLIDNERLYPAV